MVRRLKTCSFRNLDPGGAGNIVSATFFLNSAKDPLGTASATDQGLGYDQYESLYNKYCVIGWKVTFEVVSLDNSSPLLVGFTPSTDINAPGSYNQALELPGTVWRTVTPDVDKVAFGTRGTVKKWLMPRGGKLLTELELNASVAASPARLLYGHFWTQPVDQATDTAAVRFVYVLEQIVVFYDPKMPSRSTQ